MCQPWLWVSIISNPPLLIHPSVGWSVVSYIHHTFPFGTVAPKGWCPVDHRGEFLPSFHPSVLLSFCPSILPSFCPPVVPSENSPLCPTERRPFGAADLLSLNFFSRSLQAGHWVPLTMCYPWMTSSFCFFLVIWKLYIENKLIDSWWSSNIVLWWAWFDIQNDCCHSNCVFCVSSDFHNFLPSVAQLCKHQMSCSFAII